MTANLFELSPASDALIPVVQLKLESEGLLEAQHLENWVVKASVKDCLFDRKILWIARQDRPETDQRSDLVGISEDGDVVVAELKRGKVDSGAIMQGLTYAVRYSQLSRQQLSVLYAEHSQKQNGARSINSGVVTPEEALASIDKFVPSESVDGPIEVNARQTVLLLGEEFSADALATCDYLNRRLSAGAELLIECWQCTLSKPSSGNRLVSFTKIIPPPELAAEIATRRVEAQQTKWSRDPNRTAFIQAVRTAAAPNGFVASQPKGSSYKVVLRLSDVSREQLVTVYAHDDYTIRLFLEPERASYPADGTAIVKTDSNGVKFIEPTWLKVSENPLTNSETSQLFGFISALLNPETDTQGTIEGSVEADMHVRPNEPVAYTNPR